MRQQRAGSARSEVWGGGRVVTGGPSGSAAVVSKREGRRHIVVLCASAAAQPCQPAFRRPHSMCSWSSGRNHAGRLRTWNSNDFDALACSNASRASS